MTAGARSLAENDDVVRTRPAPSPALARGMCVCYSCLMLRNSIPGAVGALLHLILLAGTVALIVHEGGSAWPRFWTLFLALDFPVSLGIVPVTWLAPAAPGGPLHDPSNFWWPLVYHGIVGTGWWYIVGWAIGARIQRWRGGRGDRRRS